MPGIRIIESLRNPMDNGFSIYMASMRVDRSPWSTDLNDIAFMIQQYTRLMDHWKMSIGLTIKTVQYEELVALPDSKSKEIIDFLGLDWDEKCLDFHNAERDVNTLSYNQVRKPLYTGAIDRWRNYEQQLLPLQEALSRSGLL